MYEEHYVFHSHSFMYYGGEADNYYSCDEPEVDIAQIYQAASGDSRHTTDEEQEGDDTLHYEHDEVEREASDSVEGSRDTLEVTGVAQRSSC